MKFIVFLTKFYQFFIKILSDFYSLLIKYSRLCVDVTLLLRNDDNTSMARVYPEDESTLPTLLHVDATFVSMNC